MNRHTADIWIDHLDLLPHPEGGFYRETYRSDKRITRGTLSGYSGDRDTSTAIYYLLQSGDASHFHRLKSDEMLHFYDGSSGIIHCISAEGERGSKRLGLNIEQGDHPQVLIQRDTWFAAEVTEPDSFILLGCTVAPGFDFDDFQLGSRAELLERFPQHKQIISRLTFPD